jgi:predicted RNA binding protein YcfA (HicA-like mRNA interferase family)
MPRLPQVRGAELLRALQKIGFYKTRQRGSHVQLRREEDDGSFTTFPVPVHAGKTLKPGTLKGILRKADLDVEELLKLL